MIEIDAAKFKEIIRRGMEHLFRDPLHEIVAEVTGIEPLPLEAERFVQAGPGITLDRDTAFLLSASVGAAMRAF